MITIKNNQIEICKFKMAAKKENETITAYFSCLEDANLLKDEVEAQGFDVMIDELEIEQERFLDGTPCNSLGQAYAWLEAGEVVEPVTLDGLVEVVADMIGGALE